MTLCTLTCTMFMFMFEKFEPVDVCFVITDLFIPSYR